MQEEGGNRLPSGVRLRQPWGHKTKAPRRDSGQESTQGLRNELMKRRTTQVVAQATHERACRAVALEILDLLAEPGQPIMRELDSGAWITVQHAFLLTKEQLKNSRDWRAQWLRENKLKPGELYVTLNRWTPGGDHDGTYVERVTARQRIHVRPRHELLVLDYDSANRDILEQVLKELEALGCRIMLRVSSMRDGHPHLHVWIACTSYEQRLTAEAVVTERLDRKMIRTHGISVPGFSGKVFRDGVRAVWNDKFNNFEDVPTYDRTQRELMRVCEGTNLELLTELRDWLLQVPRWDLPEGVTLYGGTEQLVETRRVQPSCPVGTFVHEGKEYADTLLVRRHLGLREKPSSPATPVPLGVSPVVGKATLAAAPEALPDVLNALLDKDVPLPKKQAYDAYEPDDAARNGWAIMCVARQVGISAERLWQERHRPGMKHFRSFRQLDREYASVDAASTRGGDRRLAWALTAQQDDRLTVFEKRFILHIAVKKGLVFGYGNIADAIGCSKMQITHMMRDDNVLRYVRKSGNIVKPGTGREAQTFEIVAPP